MAVYVLDKRKRPLMPCSEKRARQMLTRRRAVVHKMYPFTIRLKDRIGGSIQITKIKIDPGSRYTGVAVVRETRRNTVVSSLMQLNHRGLTISKNLTARAALRRGRRAKLRYRKARFNNRTKPKGWLAPSLQHRVDTIVSWVAKLKRITPVLGLSQELVRFDMALINNPAIKGKEYQQGNLLGYETREYLLEKWNRECAYCGASSVPLEVEHIKPRSKGGSHALSNLTLACRPCNQRKSNRPIEEFLAKKPLVLKKILGQAKRPLKDAAAVNSTRWALAEALSRFNLPLELASGGETKFNRMELGVPKDHALDAACVGWVGEELEGWNVPTLVIKCNGRGRYGRTLTDKFGFPRGYLMKTKSVYGFQTGDTVEATVPTGAKAGRYVGRVVVRKKGFFDIGPAKDIPYRYCKLIARNDGYGYSFKQKIA